MEIKERSWSVSSYRYGFNGMERDDEVKGSGNSYDFGARIYDSRLGRWMSRDAYEVRHPQLTTYGFAANNPILLIDVGGNDWFLTSWTTDAQKAAFKGIIENRFDGAVTVSFTNVMEKEEYTVKEKYKGTLIDVVKTRDVIREVQVTMTINEEVIRQKIIADNPNATADDVTNLTNQYISDLKSSSTYSFLDEQFNTQNQATVRNVTLEGSFEIADFESQSINASAIATAGKGGFTILYHEIAEQAAKAQGLSIDGLNRSNGYPAAHWFGLQKQGEASGGVMVINHKSAYTGSLTSTLYKAVSDGGGNITGYTATDYDVSNVDGNIVITELSTRSLSVSQFNKEIQAEKKKINDTFKDEE
jgi:RHS repeat-associated protein